MSVTYILHGGETSRPSAHNDSFFAEFTANVDKPLVKILLCYWAREEQEWDRLLKRDTEKIGQQTHKQLKLDLTTSPSDLFAKINDFDVLYVAGGEAHLLEPSYSQLSDLPNKLEGKVYVGSSMGAFMVSSHYILSSATREKIKVSSGLKILPIKTLCHWDVESSKSQKLALLEQQEPKLPILTLDECKYTKLIF